LTPPLTHVALDLMDTVVRDPFFTRVPHLLGLSTAEEVVDLLDPEVWIAFETGAIDEPTYLKRMFRASQTSPVTAGAIRQVIVEGYTFLPGLEELLGRLRGARLWVLSNYSTWFELLRRKLDLDRFFEGYVVSCETGFRKPDPRAYQALLHRCGALPQCCLFVDDRAANVEGALAAGMEAVCFVDAGTLEKTLTSHGLL
jgi:putative hydrolase of the HAD superfamily